jgi:DNA-binding response OmpR family regulator
MSNILGLVIEDDFDAANIFAAALKATGIHTEIISDGKTALARLNETTPRVIILDMHLPEIAGPDILRQIRADDRLKETRVLVATADPRMAESVEDIADLVLIKPITFSQVRDLAERLNLLG